MSFAPGFGPRSAASGALRLSARAVFLLLVTAVPDESPALAAATPVLSGLEWLAEADLELVLESRGDERQMEITFDEVALGAETDWWSAEAAIKYRSEGGRGLVLEEGMIEIGGTEELAPFLRIGRTGLPFAQIDALFLSDPLAVQLGETQDDAVGFGVRLERLSLECGVYREELGDPGHLSTCATIAVVPFADPGPLGSATAALAWTQDIGESVELRELHTERGGGNERAARTGGLEVRVEMDGPRSSLRFGYVSALGRLPAGFVADGSLRPSGWDLEYGRRFGERTLVALRMEGAREFPDAPHLQAGVGATWEISDRMDLGWELLRADYEDGPPGLTTGLTISIAL